MLSQQTRQELSAFLIKVAAGINQGIVDAQLFPRTQGYDSYSRCVFVCLAIHLRYCSRNLEMAKLTNDLY